MPEAIHISEPILTEHLIVRPYQEADLDALFGIVSRADVARYQYWAPRTRGEAEGLLAQRLTRNEIEDEGDCLNLAVALRTGGPMIGDVVLMYLSAQHHQAELGYTFHPDVHGRGLATEAVAVMVDLAFTTLGVHRVSAHLDARNEPSARLLERLGMRREAHLVQNEWVKGEWTDDVVYALLADEWLARRLGAP